MASLSDYQFLETFKTKRVIITTKSNRFMGVVQRVNLNKTIILEQVEELRSGIKLPGAKLFFGFDILNVEFPSSTSSNVTKPGESEADGARVLGVPECQPYRRGLMDDDDDKQWVNYVVVDKFHENFSPALMHIYHQKVIGVGVDRVEAFDHKRLCWLQVATKDKVFLFDILVLGAKAFKNGLSAILTSDKILKVIHDCRAVARCLMAQFGVALVNVFDTQVADVLHFYNQTGGFFPDRVGTLQEVISSHLEIPAGHLSSLKIKKQLEMDDMQVWYTRPCPVPLLKVMAISVIHLQPLRLVLLDLFMSDYTDLVDSYLRSAQDDPVGYKNIGGTLLELPKELRELETIRNTRQTQAVKFYQLTEDGLLKRHCGNSCLDPHPKRQESNPYTDGTLDCTSHSSTSSRRPGPSERFPTSPGHSAKLELDSTPNLDIRPKHASEMKDLGNPLVPGLGRGVIRFAGVVPMPEVVPTLESASDKKDMTGVQQRNLTHDTHLFPGIGQKVFQRPL